MNRLFNLVLINILLILVVIDSYWLAYLLHNNFLVFLGSLFITVLLIVNTGYIPNLQEELKELKDK
jgi:hypothetical protein